MATRNIMSKQFSGLILELIIFCFYRLLP